MTRLVLLALLAIGCGDNLAPDPDPDPIVQRCRESAERACSSATAKGDARCFYAFAWRCSPEDERAARQLCADDERAHCLDGLPYWL